MASTKNIEKKFGYLPAPVDMDAFLRPDWFKAEHNNAYIQLEGVLREPE